MKPACYDITPTLQSYSGFFLGKCFANANQLNQDIKLIGVVLDA